VERAPYSIRCEYCDEIVVGQNEDDLVLNMQRHRRQRHDMPSTEDEVREQIREASSPPGSRMTGGPYR
jgi:predicted small metal-binding protein